MAFYLIHGSTKRETVVNDLNFTKRLFYICDNLL